MMRRRRIAFQRTVHGTDAEHFVPETFGRVHKPPGPSNCEANPEAMPSKEGNAP